MDSAQLTTTYNRTLQNVINYYNWVITILVVCV
jgi:hypothetical protein